ncbi:helix-turn-helix transcriptional regulator [Cytophagaceae bacterium YF14B1]|uniref:Helix-turn-helix transcriptional regulator n=1 Tax=Xanthocytophaga flava TaxID=3048013 RepID=A0AAE3QT34_9BACT|nr:helix-turn-helix transcriptional regulator [Xanthocytophaga flavus]MDJ1482349.1 helix-turn-helix transcriptional regulator [Xanthocytophaga flavus]
MKYLRNFVLLKRIFSNQNLKDKLAKPETIEEYYANRPFLSAAEVDRNAAHFNIFRIGDPDIEDIQVPFGRKDYFKICIITGNSRIHYADKTFEVREHGLLFANPQIPYNWEPLTPNQQGFSCIFNEAFFERFGRIKEYPVFKPGGFPVYELTTEELSTIKAIFEQILNEKNGQFEFKDDAIRTLILQLIHSAIKMRPAINTIPEKVTAASRITSLFLELLERQFPLESTSSEIQLRSASDFANQMAVHVNHLNKSVKEVTAKTTSEIIMQRLLQEAKIMLKHTSWPISDIAYALGFEGPTHFSTFIKRQLQLSPSQYRNT